MLGELFGSLGMRLVWQLLEVWSLRPNIFPIQRKRTLMSGVRLGVRVDIEGMHVDIDMHFQS